MTFSSNTSYFFIAISPANGLFVIARNPDFVGMTRRSGGWVVTPSSTPDCRSRIGVRDRASLALAKTVTTSPFITPICHREESRYYRDDVAIWRLGGKPLLQPRLPRPDAIGVRDDSLLFGIITNCVRNILLCVYYDQHLK